jgi:hypothetical protein
MAAEQVAVAGAAVVAGQVTTVGEKMVEQA